MSRHLRRIERLQKARERWKYNQPLRAIVGVGHRMSDVSRFPSDKMLAAHYGLYGQLPEALSTPATVTNLDADHAVAIEREAIAVWLENNILSNWSARGSVLAPGYTLVEMAVRGRGTTPQDLIDAIRNGDHHANTPPNAQERGQDAR